MGSDAVGAGGSITRWASKTDTAHAEIRDGLRDIGYRVWDCHKYGSGFPDLLVLARGEFFLFEIKSKYGKLKPKERDFFDLFQGSKTYIVKSLEDAILCINGPD